MTQEARTRQRTESMVLGDRLRQLREAKKLSQGDIERRTGLLRCYISRVENGHTDPSIETLEKFAQALELKTYQLFYFGEEDGAGSIFFNANTHRANAQNGRSNSGKDESQKSSSRKEERFIRKLRRLLIRMKESDRQLLLFFVEQIARLRPRQ